MSERDGRRRLDGGEGPRRGGTPEEGGGPRPALELPKESA
jgi:hypothetical protein